MLGADTACDADYSLDGQRLGRARASLFETVAWTAPTLVGATLNVPDREKIVALYLGAD